MLPRRLVLSLLPLALMALACASPDRLARQSDQELQAGNLRKAYETGRRALEKDASNVNARAAYVAAARQLSDDFQGRVLRLVAADTVEAARVSLDYRDLRAEIARYPVTVETDAAYVAREDAIVANAAAIRYREGIQSLALSRPKEAYRRFVEAQRFDPGYRDVGQRIGEAYQRALTRVAVVPFENTIEVPGLPRQLEQRIAAELIRRSASPAFQFTRVVDPASIDQRMTVAQAEGLTREQARALGRTLGADRVVCGRLTGLRSNSDSRDHTFPIYHLEQTTGPDNQPVERWVESSLRVIERERRVSVICQYDVIDVRSGAVLATESNPFDAGARVVWSDDQVSGDCDGYQLAPSKLSGDQATRAKRSQETWGATMGDWTVPQTLEAARASDRRSHWDSRWRDEFVQQSRPVFLGELPAESDLVFVALHDSWKPVLTTLHVLDPDD